MKEWKWSHQRIKAAKLLASGEYSVEEAARALGISERTIYKWKKCSEFTEYIQELERAAREEAKRHLVRHALHAARRLVELSERGQPKDSVRLKATLEILDRCGVIAVQGVDVVNAPALVAILPAVQGDGAYEKYEKTVDSA